MLAFTQFVEPVLRFVLALTSWGAGSPPTCPGAGGRGDRRAAASTPRRGVGTLLEPWQGALVLLAYGVGLAAIGRVTTFRRDIT